MHTRYVVAHCCVVAHYCVVAHCGSSLFSLNLRSIRPYGYAPQLRCKISNKFAMHKSRVPPSPRTPRTSARSCRIPTSNRNYFAVSKQQYSVVYHYNPTSNRNYCPAVCKGRALYIIIILHQTATALMVSTSGAMLYIIIILHQTATVYGMLLKYSLLYIIIILHQTATPACDASVVAMLYIIIILHQTATL